MTPALHDPVFRKFVVILLGILLAAGLLLALLEFVFRIRVGSVWKTYFSWLVMAPLAAGAILGGRAVFILGVSLLALCALREFARVARLELATGVVVSAGIVALGASAFFAPPLFSLVAIVAGALVLLLPILRNRAHGALAQVSLGLIALLYLGWMFGHLALLADMPRATGYLCFILLATELCDVAAFCFGKMFGRHLLRSEISPRKTWEGALGALVVALALPWLLRFSLPVFGSGSLLLTGVIVGIGGPLGDLSISLCKRDLGAKDMGTAIPGHGGVLDRIDSLLFVAPLFTALVEHYSA